MFYISVNYFDNVRVFKNNMCLTQGPVSYTNQSNVFTIIRSRYLLKSKSEVISLSENMATNMDSVVN